jgi:arabinose-5-phosphate isomerase
MNPAERVFDFAIETLIRTKSIVNTPQFQQAVELVSTHRVWTTGMGKASLIAHKLAATLACNSIAAGFIHAGEALHGDFGAIQSGDVLVAFTNSGKTDEVLRVSKKAKENGAFLVVLTSSRDSEISKVADIALTYGEIKEACPLGLTPTTSVMVMLAISDAIAMAAQKYKGITYADYARNHHSGYLGAIAREKSHVP